MKNLLIFFMSLMAYSSLYAQQIPVLIYHQVNNAYSASPTIISPDRLIEHLDVIQRNGYNTITISKLSEYMNGRLSIPEKSVVITFDDGFDDVLFAAAELLKRDMSATFFILSDTGVLYRPERYLTKEQIKWLSEISNFEIGSHGHTHFMEWKDNLKEMPDSVIVGEAVISKMILESIINKPVTSFAWPYGYARIPLISFFKELGFTSTSLVNSESRNDSGISSYTIQRINVDGRCTGEQFLKMIESMSIVKCE